MFNIYIYIVIHYALFLTSNTFSAANTTYDIWWLYTDLYEFIKGLYTGLCFHPHTLETLPLWKCNDFMGYSAGPGPDKSRWIMCGLTAWPFADDSMCAVFAGARLPQSTIALDPEAWVWREHGEGVHFPVDVRHLCVFTPHQTTTCGRNRGTQTHTAEPKTLGFILKAVTLSFHVLSDISVPSLASPKLNCIPTISFWVISLKLYNCTDKL